MMLNICFRALLLSVVNLQKRFYVIFFYLLRMIHQVSEPAHVVHQVNEPNPGLRSFDPDAPDPSANQKADPAEDALNPRPNRRLLFVHCLLKGAQGMVPIPLAMDMILNASFLQKPTNLLRRIRAIPPYGLTGIGRIKQGFSLLTVMDMSRRYFIRSYQLMLDVYIDMVLIPVIRLIALFRPSGISVLLPQLCRLFFPLSRNLTILNLPILLRRVALPGDLHDTGIHDHPLFRLVAGIIQIPAKQGKELLDRPRTGYRLAEQPNRFFIRDRIFRTHPDKASKRKAVYQLKLGLGIRQIVHMLQDHNLEHHEVVKGRSAGIALSLLAKGAGDYRLKSLPVNGLIEPFQRIAQLAQRLQFLLYVKKSKLTHDTTSYYGNFIFAYQRC